MDFTKNHKKNAFNPRSQAVLTFLPTSSPKEELSRFPDPQRFGIKALDNPMILSLAPQLRKKEAGTRKSESDLRRASFLNKF